MPSRTIGLTLVTAGLVLAVAGPRATPRGEAPGWVPADTVAADQLARVTMEPIQVVLSYEERLESVTMETIRVEIPRAAEAEARPER